MAILNGRRALNSQNRRFAARAEGAEAAALEAKEASEAVMVEGREAVGKVCLCSPSSCAICDQPLAVQAVAVP